MTFSRPCCVNSSKPAQTRRTNNPTSIPPAGGSDLAMSYSNSRLMLRSSILFCAAIAALGQTPRQTIFLWPDGAPGTHGDTDADKPALTLYPASGPKKIDVGVVVCPGGSYHNLAMDHEGTQVAEWLNERGISAFVLRYRLGPKYHF